MESNTVDPRSSIDDPRCSVDDPRSIFPVENVSRSLLLASTSVIIVIPMETQPGTDHKG